MRLFFTRYRALIALVLLVIVWSYSWVVMKQAMQHAGPFDFAALRYLGGAAVLFILMLLQNGRLTAPPLLPTLAIGIAQTAAFQALAQWALVTGGAGKVSLFCYTMPFWVVLFSWWWLKEKPSTKQWTGLCLAALGLFLVIAPWQGLGNWESVTLAVGGGMAWAIGAVLSKRLFVHHSASPLQLTAWSMLFGALALCFIAWQVPSRPIDWSPQFLLELAYSAILASSLAWALWTFIVQELPTSVAGLSSLMVPVGAILLGWLILDETPGIIGTLGVCVILAGLLIVRPKR